MINQLCVCSRLTLLCTCIAGCLILSGGGGGRGGAELGKEVGQCWLMLYHIDVFSTFSVCAPQTHVSIH